MQKFFQAVILLGIIFLTFSLIILRVLSHGPENNFFNAGYRARFAQYPMMRNILDMHNDGDARADYLGKRNSKIVIEVDSMQTLSVSAEALDVLTEKIAAVTGKSVSYYISDRNIPYRQTSDLPQIEDMAKNYRNYVSGDNTATIYLLYLNEPEGQKDQLGSTYQDFGMYIFDAPLRKATASNPALFDDYFESTALHEFGHLLGLKHNNYAGCLMQAFVDQTDIERQNHQDVITDFCDQEKELIRTFNF